MINRRGFLGVAGRSAALFLASGRLPSLSTDTVILRGGLVFDGTGVPGKHVDVALRGDRIVAVGPNLKLAGAKIIDVRGLAIAPGFIDVHSHTDLSLFIEPRAESKIRQGVTLEVTGQDGGSVGPWSEEEARTTSQRYKERYGVELPLFTQPGSFLASLEHLPIGVNMATMVGNGTVRGLVIGERDREATPAELARMQELVRAELNAGACGLSSGLEYVPSAFAKTDELIALSKVLQGTGLPYASHMRNEDDRLLAAIEEALAVGRFGGVPVQISHLKAQGQRNWYKAKAALDMIDSARSDGIDVAFDRYPYVAYSTGLSNLFPVWARDGGSSELMRRLQDANDAPRIRAYVDDKINQLGSWDAVQISSTGADSLAWARGKRLGKLATERGKTPYDMLIELTMADQDRTGMIGFGMDEPNTERFLAHPLAMICSDGGAKATSGPNSEGSPHPRCYGTFARVLGHYVRDRKIMPLHTAIAKMTSKPARRLKFKDRGVIKVGAYADVVAFDPARIADRATFEAPHAYAVGVQHVWVNGEQVIRDAAHTGALPGRVVRPG